MLGQLARRRAWKRLVDISASMLVAHRGGGAPGLTVEQVKICACMYPPWVAGLSTVEAVEIGEGCALLEAGARFASLESGPVMPRSC